MNKNTEKVPYQHGKQNYLDDKNVAKYLSIINSGWYSIFIVNVKGHKIRAALEQKRNES